MLLIPETCPKKPEFTETQTSDTTNAIASFPTPAAPGMSQQVGMSTNRDVNNNDDATRARRASFKLARVFLNRLGWGRDSGSGAAMSRIQQSVVVVDTADAVAQFHTLNRDIHLFCDKTAANINKIYLIPAEPYRPDNPDVPKRAPIHFPSTEDYWYFVLLSIMNCALCRFIFDPFHPSDWLEERGSGGGYGHANANANASQIPQRESHELRC